ncbi:MAG TPA: glutamyl-tRNA reductase [Ktedonobacteraceae bacterium]|jgi:glutamyl-tRNA reductase|nr:glutamyl-tRNA reductase [Ktedonobacteraceae bacterium]
MHIVLVGVDHSSAPIALREQLACSSRQLLQVLDAVHQVTQEAVLLSTCNRVELYAICQESSQGREDLLHVLSETLQVSYDELAAHCYNFIDDQAVAHLFGVACGLYSLVPGEPQIQGQVADALEVAQQASSAGPITSALFRAAVVVGKRARSETAISRNAASVSHVAVQLARRLLPDLNAARVLLVGSGQMSELAARNLRDNGARQLVIINRTSERAQALAQSLNAVRREFAELAEALVEADVVISSTTSPCALITAPLMQRVMERRAGRSLLLIDIALPRDVEPAVGALPGVHLYNLDDLQSEVERGIKLRLREVERVEAIINEEVNAFKHWLASLSVVDTISDLRQRADAVRQQELARTLRQISPSLSEREVAAIQELTTRFMNKLLHIPTLRLKAAAADGQGHMYAEALRYLFGLEENNGTDNHRDAGQPARHDTNIPGNRPTAPAVARP